MKVTIIGAPLAQLPLLSEELMRDIGDLALRRIRTRTENQTAVDGSPFQPLSPDYAALKQRELGHQRADLQVSGRMLNDMSVVAATQTSVTLGFRSQGGGGGGGTFIQRSRALGAADKAFFHNEGGRVLRPFFELNDEDEAAIAEAVDRHLARVLGG